MNRRIKKNVVCCICSVFIRTRAPYSDLTFWIFVKQTFAVHIFKVDSHLFWKQILWNLGRNHYSILVRDGSDSQLPQEGEPFQNYMRSIAWVLQESFTVRSEGFLYKVAPLVLKFSQIVFFSVVLFKILVHHFDPYFANYY